MGMGGGRTRFGLPTWSVNTWLIVACISVFALDGFLPRREVLMDTTAQVTSPQEWMSTVTELARSPAAASVTRDAETNQPVAVDLVLQRYQRGNPLIIQRTSLQRSPDDFLEVTETQHVMPVLRSFLHFSTARGFLRLEFWRFIGFQFLHADLGHVLFNMIGLFFFGPMVERYLGSKRYLAFYLLCGIFGACAYLLLNLAGFVVHDVVGASFRIPGLLLDSPTTPLIGASAGVFGVLMAGAFIAPNTTVLLFFIIPMRLRTLAYLFTALAAYKVLVGAMNAGGEAGHLGGAFAGFYFIRHPKHLHGFFDILGRVDPTSHHYRGKPSAARAVKKMRGAPAGASMAEVDRILDKVHDRGLASLSEKEKRILREASEHG